MRLSQLCENELLAQYSFTSQAKCIAKKYMHSKQQQRPVVLVLRISSAD